MVELPLDALGLDRRSRPTRRTTCSAGRTLSAGRDASNYVELDARAAARRTSSRVRPLATGGAASARARHRPADRPALVQGRDHLRAARPRLHRQRRRRLGRLPGPRPASSTTWRTSASPPSGCCRSIPRRCATTATTSPTTRASTRTTGRCATSRTFIREAHERGLRVITELVCNHTSDQHPWFQRARRAGPGCPSARLLRVERHARQVQRRAHHLQGLRDARTGRGTRSPAPYYWHRFYSPPARPELRQPQGPRGDPAGRSTSGSTWASTGCASTPSRTSTSARARTARTCPRRTRSCASCARTSTRSYARSDAARRGEPVAGGLGRLLRRRATSATCASTSRSCRACSWRCAWRTAFRIVDILEQTPAISRDCAVGALPAQPRRADARDGHRRGARLHVPRLRARPAGAHQPRHPPPARAAAGQQPPAHRAA